MKVNAAKKELFCEVLVRGQSPAGAARAIGVDRATVYRWRAVDPEFAEAWDTARETKVEMVETVLYRMAVEQDLGAICFFLKAHRPELYNKRMLIGLGGDPDNPLSVNHGIDDSEPWVIMMPENGRDRPDPDTATGPTIEGDADDAAA